MICDICAKRNKCAEIISVKNWSIPSCYLSLEFDIDNINMDDIVYFVSMVYAPETRTKYRYIATSMTYSNSLLCVGEIFKDKSSAELYANTMNAYRSKYF